MRRNPFPWADGCFFAMTGEGWVERVTMASNHVTAGWHGSIFGLSVGGWPVVSIREWH